MAGDEQRIVFLGPPNSGKGTQAALLAEAVGIPAISTGEMLRAAVAAGSSLGEKVKDVMTRGDLVDDDLMAAVIRDRLSHDDAQRGFLLDGYPRTAAQAATLEEVLGEMQVDLDAVVQIDAPETVLIARALGRGREDDQEEIVQERLRIYQKKTAPLVDFYEVKGLLRRIDGHQAVDEVSAQVRSSLGVATP